MRDFKTAARIEPNNKETKLRLAECEQVVKRIAFEKAIEVTDAPSAFKGLNVDSIKVDKSYDGADLGKEITQEFIDDMIARFKNGKKIHRKYVYQIIQAVYNIVYEEHTMFEM